MRDELDLDLLRGTVLELYRHKQGELMSVVVHLGERLGLFAALAEAQPCDSDALATATGYHERWVREWLYAVAAADLADHDDGEFALTPEARAVLVDEGHPASMIGVFGPPLTWGEVDRTAEAFTTGIGMTWDEHGSATCHFQAAMGAAQQQTWLAPVILAGVPGLTERLAAGIRVVDVGCGAGVAAHAIATAFPDSTVVGIDPSPHAIDAASQRAAGLDNCRFTAGTFDDLAGLGPVDLLVTLDVIHDLPRPDAAMAAARAALADDGVWLLADIKARGGLEDNREIPLAPMLYGMSIVYCMSSGMSEPGGAGLGTLGLTVETLEALAEGAGFGSVEVREFEVDPLNRYFELRP